MPPNSETPAQDASRSWDGFFPNAWKEKKEKSFKKAVANSNAYQEPNARLKSSKENTRFNSTNNSHEQKACKTSNCNEKSRWNPTDTASTTRTDYLRFDAVLSNWKISLKDAGSKTQEPNLPASTRLTKTFPRPKTKTRWKRLCSMLSNRVYEFDQAPGLRFPRDSTTNVDTTVLRFPTDRAPHKTRSRRQLL